MELCSFTLDDYVHRRPGPDCQDLPEWEFVMKSGTVEERVALIGSIMKQILNGLIFIHDQNEVHRDLHPVNGNQIGSQLLKFL